MSRCEAEAMGVEEGEGEEEERSLKSMWTIRSKETGIEIETIIFPFKIHFKDVQKEVSRRSLLAGSL